MKKNIIILLILILIAFIINNLDFKKNNLEHIRVAEVAHSIFYAPQYIAQAKKYFKQENLDLEILLTPGADKVIAAVLSGDIQIGFCGCEAPVYVYKNNQKDYIQIFAGLTKKDGSFLVSRKEYADFKISDLKNKYIIGGRKGGIPEMTLEFILKQNNLKPNQDLFIDTSINFAAMQGAFISGIGDFVVLFEPNATQLEKKKLGNIVMPIGKLAGEFSYTAYNAKKSFINSHQDIIKKFTRAINKALEFIKNNSSHDIAQVIINYFPEISLEDLEIILERYKKLDVWFENSFISQENFYRMQEIMINSKELSELVPYEKLVINFDAQNK